MAPWKKENTVERKRKEEREGKEEKKKEQKEKKKDKKEGGRKTNLLPRRVSYVFVAAEPGDPRT